MAELLAPFSAQIISDEQNVKNVLKTIDQDLAKQVSKEELIQQLVCLISSVDSKDQLSSDPNVQLQQVNNYVFSSQTQINNVNIQLAIILLNKFQQKLSNEQKHSLLLYLYKNHQNTNLHKQTLQLLIKQFNELNLAQNIYILLQYFTLASQQTNNMYIILFNTITYHFINLNNFYSAFEFFKRNRSKVFQVIRLQQNNIADTDLNHFYYQSALLVGASAQFSTALHLLKFCDIKADQKYQYLSCLLRILTNQEIDFIDYGDDLMNKVQLYYLNSQIRYLMLQNVDYVDRHELKAAIQRNKQQITDLHFHFLFKQIQSDCFEASLKRLFLSKVYASKNVEHADLGVVNRADLFLQDGSMVFKTHVALYDSDKPRTMLLEQLGRRIEVQKLIGLKNVKPEEECCNIEQGEDSDWMLDDFMDFYEASD